MDLALLALLALLEKLVELVDLMHLARLAGLTGLLLSFEPLDFNSVFWCSGVQVEGMHMDSDRDRHRDGVSIMYSPV